MKEYITRREALIVLEEMEDIESGFAAMYEIPAADVVEVRHGRWIEQEKYTFGVMYDCSICDNRILDNGHSWNYCPNCGAKMDKEEE